MRQTTISCALMRGGTSKGLVFEAKDLPSETGLRDKVLLAAMGSPDPRQIDGVGGANPLTSKVAIVSPATREDADIDYLFLQVVVDQARVDSSQNCGNMLAAVGPFAIERGLIKPISDVTDVRIHMVNSQSIVIASIQTPGGSVAYDGDSRIDGVPGTAAPIPVEFLDIAGSSCGALLPSGNVRDQIDGIDVTCIDNGMPVVLIEAASLGLTGRETPLALESNEPVRKKIEAIRLEAGRMMNLGDVTSKTIPKMSIVSRPNGDETITTRTFIPHRVHDAIGVFGAVSVASACVLPGSVAHKVARLPGGDGVMNLEIAHPTGFFTVEIEPIVNDSSISFKRAALLRTARLLMTGEVHVPGALWDLVR